MTAITPGRALGVIVAFGAGLAIGWLGRSTSLDAEGKQRAEPRSMAPREETTNTVRVEDHPVRPEDPPSQVTTPARPADHQAVQQEPLLSRSATTVSVPTADANTIFQAGKDGRLTATDAAPLQRLLDAVRISCQFDPGYGAQWNNGQVAILSAAWQGGPIMYDEIAVAGGTAMMLGSEGATGSQTGEVKVRVAATSTGLHFSGFVPRGDLISTTIFAALGDKQRFIAVMSTHATEVNHNSSQFHGACDVLS